MIQVCALQYDFNLFDKGDETIVCDKGHNLSKGQQARVNLARAIYKNSDIYLLDDSLTALDGHVQDFIFSNCVKMFLRDKIVLLVSQTVRHIQEADEVVVMSFGKIKVCGPPKNVYKEEVRGLTAEIVAQREEVFNSTEDEGKYMRNSAIETEQTTEKTHIYREINKKGKVGFRIYLKYFLFGGGLLLMLMNLGLFALKQFSESYSVKLLTRW